MCLKMWLQTRRKYVPLKDVIKKVLERADILASSMTAYSSLEKSPSIQFTHDTVLPWVMSNTPAMTKMCPLALLGYLQNFNAKARTYFMGGNEVKPGYHQEQMFFLNVTSLMLDMSEFATMTHLWSLFLHMFLNILKRRASCTQHAVQQINTLSIHSTECPWR